jgi:tripartite-type tricarboxylate transporter receptor subunit TctC
MTLPRREFLHLAGGAVAASAAPRLAHAETYPARPVHIIVGFPPGAASDINARLIGEWLSQRLGQQFVVDNRPGAGSNVGTEAVVHSPADGYTLLLVTPPNAINAAVYDNLTFNFLRDITAVAGIMRTPMVMEINAALPINSVAAFITYAKANPGKLNFASSGNGTGSHVAAELFKFMTGIDMVHVPYRGPAQALTDLISGRVQVMFDVLTSSIAHIRAGEVRALAVTTTMRSAALPDIPTVADTVPGYESSGWAGLGAPAGTPADVVKAINDAVAAGLADAKLDDSLANLGAAPMPMAPAAFGQFLADETAKWAKVVQVRRHQAELTAVIPGRAQARARNP